MDALQSDRPRMWRSLDTLIEYLRKDLHIVRVDGIDATHYLAADLTLRGRPDTAARTKRAHEAAAYDVWFKAEVEHAIKEAGIQTRSGLAMLMQWPICTGTWTSWEKKAKAKAKVHA